ncbi:unnamed protein product [Cylicocyclus nassatus]|uniref:Uncharacterized protein n=1 Tax=Cylicocyclus nassatus TaxID=53992 RepID=A0AA36H2N0_CYLNA|nr:unnamed protein product [Cylicocyclus nassatus]
MMREEDKIEEDGNRDEQLIRILSTPNRYDRTMKTHTHTWLPASTTTTVGYAADDSMTPRTRAATDVGDG